MAKVDGPQQEIEFCGKSWHHSTFDFISRLKYNPGRFITEIKVKGPMKPDRELEEGSKERNKVKMLHKALFCGIQEGQMEAVTRLSTSGL